MDESILEEAQRLVLGDRMDGYGDPGENMARVARLWSVVLGVDVSAEQVALCMVLMKVSRQCNGYKRDTLVDIAGYALTIGLMYETD